MFKYSNFWNGQICSRPLALPPFLSRPDSKLEKRGGIRTPPLFSSLEKHAFGTKKYHVEECGCVRRGLSPQILITIMSNNDDLDACCAPRHGGRKTGVPNYQNHILICIVERLLPNGNKGWHLVALAYKEESGEENLRSEDDLKKNWVRKLCNNMKKPTGRMGADAKDQINQCIAIERRSLDKSSSGILGESSEDEMNPSSSSSSSSEDGEYKQEESSEEEEEVVPGMQVQPHQVGMFSQPPPLLALPPMDVMDMSEGNEDATDLMDTTINSATTDAVVNDPVSRTATTRAR